MKFNFLSSKIFRREARIFDLVCIIFFKKLWLFAIFVKGLGIVHHINDSTNKMVCPGHTGFYISHAPEIVQLPPFLNFKFLRMLIIVAD